jgi:hypothetical protein
VGDYFVFYATFVLELGCHETLSFWSEKTWGLRPMLVVIATLRRQLEWPALSFHLH